MRYLVTRLVGKLYLGQEKNVHDYCGLAAFRQTLLTLQFTYSFLHKHLWLRGEKNPISLCNSPNRATAASNLWLLDHTQLDTHAHFRTPLKKWTARRRKILCSCLFCNSGFGGLGVACWPLVPKFAGSNPAEAVGFLGRKNPQHAFLRRGSKAVGPMS